MTGAPSDPVRLAVIGVGDVGRVHAARIMASGCVRLVAVSDPSPTGREVAEALGVPNRPDYRNVLDDRPDGVIVSVPNALHAEIADFFASAGVHLLVEKPLAESLGSARAILAAAREGGVQLLVGHHRRHNRLVAAARSLVQERLGVLLATNSLVTMRKPDRYYDADWRRAGGAGPLLVNVIHEVDLLRTVCGEISAVQGTGRDLARGFDFDDTLAVLIHYASGAVGTIVVSESTPSPWSWEASVAEGMGFHTYGTSYSTFLGKEGSLSFPDLRLWHYPDGETEPGWTSTLSVSNFGAESNDPYLDQIVHFSRVIRGVEPPLVDGEDGLRNLAVIEAIRMAAAEGFVVSVDRILGSAGESVS